MSDIFRDYSFGGWIRHYRLKRKITLREFARMIEDSPANVSRMERSESPPPRNLNKIKTICARLDQPDLEILLTSLSFQHHLSRLMKEFGL